MKKIIINGAFGKMGRLLSRELASDTQYHIVAKLGREDNLAAALAQHPVDAVLDFSVATSAFAVAQTIIEHQVRPVIGTSGILPEQVEQLQQRCAERKLGGIIVPNFSIASLLLTECATKIAAFYPEVEIIEAHHAQKQEAPSGTAIKTAQAIASARPKPSFERGVELLEHARGAVCDNIAIHSLRLPGIIAEQQVCFGGEGETLSLRHNVIDRKAYVAGVKLALERVMHFDSLVYGLEHLLSDRL